MHLKPTQKIHTKETQATRKASQTIYETAKTDAKIISIQSHKTAREFVMLKNNS